MEITLDVEEYSSESGVKLKWENGFELNVKVEKQEVMISGNRAGLISLARHLLTLSQASAPVGCHIHLDESNSLDEGSIDLIIGKT